jgi:endonuclease YncB( thermonuclease family)
MSGRSISDEGTGGPLRRSCAAGLLRLVPALALLSLAAPGFAQQSGRAAALGSDTLSLNGQTFRLFGIDGMDFTQSCFVDGQAQACGASATRALQILVDPAAVTCTPAGDAGGGVAFARCTGPDGDIAAKMVEEGWALAVRAQTEDYVAAEDAARAAKAGVWRGTFSAPWAYRDELRAIEADYARRAGEAARTEAEAAVTAGDIGLAGLEKGEFRTADAAPDGAPMAEHEVRFADFAPGFIAAAIPPPGIFEWRAVADVLETTRQKGIAAIRDSVLESIWTGLREHPAKVLASKDSDTYYAALRAASAEWIAAGRQPVLFVTAQDFPRWIRDWFAGKPPEGAKVTRRDDIRDGRYLGTVDGIDVYVGPTRDRASLLFTADLLAGVTFRPREDGSVLGLEVDPDAANTWIARYAMAISWLDDPVVWIEYPHQAAPTPDFT